MSEISRMTIIDTHVHLWHQDRERYPSKLWVQGALQPHDGTGRAAGRSHGSGWSDGGAQCASAVVWRGQPVSPRSDGEVSEPVRAARRDRSRLAGFFGEAGAYGAAGGVARAAHPF